ncbi:hypothetical protein KVR01_011752 [Diaporthe batatas]|uniref:uncharacterized protein n=1 Tax=Diaporthe batatas TaxID=748121 RepID=UPI001D056DD7|nr:uncharacterized protein KVR01_011752 [Diaporthe batatas]KAG8158630.1 hypothetical protein KVR01_011752 [Diaporthe batatas]
MTAGDAPSRSTADTMALDDKIDPNSPTTASTTAPTSSKPKPEDDVTTRIFQFLSTATPGTLAGIAVGLAAVTYFVLGQIGLLLIGAFGGVALYVHWEASNPDYARAVRGETGVDIVARLLGEKNSLRDVDAVRKDTEEDEAIFLAQSFADFQPETQDALNGLVDAVIRDYVKWWYDPIVPSDRSFPLSCRRVLTSFLVSVGNYLGKKRPADSFLDFLTNTSSIVIVFFSELSQAFADLPPDSTMTAADAVYNYLASNPDSNLSHLLSQRHQASKFKAVAEDLLGFLDRPTHDCDPARTFLREILAGVILEMSLQTCSKAEWINGWIVYLLEAGEPDFNQAIDVGMQTGPEANSAVFADMDGNVGNVGLTKGNRNSLDMEKARRREPAHKKKLSRADEEMEVLEEMKRMNKMLLDEDARRSKDFRAFQEGKVPETPTKEEVPQRLADALQRNANDLDIEPKPAAVSQAAPDAANTPAPSVSGVPAPEKAASTSSEERPGKEFPPTPQSVDSGNQKSTAQHGHQQSFTSFEQIVPPAQDDSDQSDAEAKQPAPLTLHNAKITIYDDGTVDKNRIRTKPTWDYLIQIEPSSSQYSGWMIVRQYIDFEKLHEVLRRIATISGITAFTEQHKELPQFKLHTRESLRGELERYLRDACWYKALAESEGMKRFLDKDQGHTRTESKGGFQAVENFGKNVFGALTSAPKGVAEGGKAIAGGVTGVFGNFGLSRKPTTQSLPDAGATVSANRLSVSTPPRADTTLTVNTMNGARKSRDSLDSQRSSIVSTQPGKMPPMERRPSYQSQGEPDGDASQAARLDRWDRISPSAMSSKANSRASSIAPLRSPLKSPSTLSLDALRLPPPPDAMPDDWGSPVSTRMSRSQENILDLSTQAKRTPNGALRQPRPTRTHTKISEQETRVAVELVFAIINELYSLSSAWNFRRTLLAAAKSFLLRPGNPSLVSIQKMIQDSVIEANSSDEGIAAHLRKLRENTLPTEEELKAWPPESSQEEKEKLREKARRLLIQSGVPAALSGVMGQNATNEALGRIFDCLQIEEVARGLMFGIMLQAMRVITH